MSTWKLISNWYRFHLKLNVLRYAISVLFQVPSSLFLVFWTFLDKSLGMILNMYLPILKAYLGFCQKKLYYICLTASYIRPMLPSKWENLSHFSTKLIYVCKKLPLALDCRQSKYSQQIFNIHVFPFWVWLLQLLSYVFSKSSSFLLQKSFKLIFAALHLSTH